MPAEHVVALIGLIGEPVLLLPWPTGSKGTERRWGHLTAEEMRNPNYLEELGRGNIGVALGGVSGNLVSVDIDDDTGLDDFLASNATIADTLRSRGRRGGNIWYRIRGPYPSLKKLKRHGREWGEWRSTGGQTIIYGTHPEGEDYRITNRKRPLEIEFDQIVWPEGVNAPRIVGTAEQDALQRSTDSHLPSASVSPPPASVFPPSSSAFLPSSSVNSVQDALAMSIPSVPGQNNAHLFTLARALKTLELTRAPFKPTERVAIFDRWHEQARARGVLREGQGRDEYLAEFLRAYRSAKYPFCKSPTVLAAVQAAKTEPEPPEAAFFHSAEARFLVSICSQLQARADGSEWYLSARTAGEFIGTSHTMAAAFLAAMVELGVLEITTPSTTKKARRYRYQPHKGNAA